MEQERTGGVAASEPRMRSVRPAAAAAVGEATTKCEGLRVGDGVGLLSVGQLPSPPPGSPPGLRGTRLLAAGEEDFSPRFLPPFSLSPPLPQPPGQPLEAAVKDPLSAGPVFQWDRSRERSATSGARCSLPTCVGADLLPRDSTTASVRRLNKALN